MRSRLRDEAGLTLVELLIAVTVMAVIVTAIGAAASVGLRTMNSTSNRLSASSTVQHLTLALPPDVESATAAIVSGISCTGARSPLLQLTDGSSFNVVYGIRSVTTGTPSKTTYQLERHVCAGGAVQSTKVIGRYLESTSAAVATRIPPSGTFVGASITVKDPSSGAHVVTVTGRRRAS